VLALDVTAPFAEIKRRMDDATEFWGRLDVAVNNAGIAVVGTTEEIGAEGIMNVMNTNFFGAVNVTNAILPHMRDRREGCVVFIGSRSVFRNQITGIGPYSASKAAVHSYAETLAVEMASFNVKVLIAIPGSFNTKFNAPPRGGTPLEGYESAHAELDAALKLLANTPKGDPALGMDVLVDVIRGEGRAVGHNSLPLWLFLGEDCMRDVRARLDHIGSVINEWEEVGTRLGLPEAAL